VAANVLGKSLLPVPKTIISKSWKVDAANGSSKSLPVPKTIKVGKSLLLTY
jgi:hypothetical protein